MPQFLSARNAQTSSAVEKLTSDGLEVYRYPTELGSDQSPHFMMFYIVERNGVVPSEQAAPANRQAPVSLSSQNRPMEKMSREAAAALFQANAGLGLADASYRTAKTVTNFGVRTMAAPLVPGAGSTVNNGIKQYNADLRTGAQKVNVLAAFAGGAIGVKAAESVMDDAGGTPADSNTLKKVIALYLNNKPKTEYKANWADTDLGVFGGGTSTLAKGLQDVLGKEGGIDDRISAANNMLSNLGGAAAYIGMQNADKSPLLRPFGGSASSAAQAAAGLALNPFKTQLFKNMGFRAFNFDYTFLPKNEAEMTQVEEIIKTFKRYMHPVLKQEQQFFLGYPAEFQIEFHYKDDVNTNLFRTSSCALTDMKVEYGGADFITIKGQNGKPAEISMSLTFLELEIMHRDRIDQGGF